MCGRINVSDHPGVQQLLDFLDIPLNSEKFESRYNIAPGAFLYSVFANTENNAFKINPMVWGILPPWAKPEKFSRPLINARSETIWEKPSFRHLIKAQRAIIPINGFYEWKRENKVKTAFHIHSKKQDALALAGIYQLSKDGSMQCCIVTTDANQSMSRVHNRMPVILQTENYNDWLLSNDKSQIDTLMSPCPETELSIDQVSSYVNNASNDGPKCVQMTEQSSLNFD